MPTCRTCGRENPEGFRFCGACGAELDGEPAQLERRKAVTVVFCDLIGSTALGETTDPEALRTTMRAYYGTMRAILERHGGTVEKFVGDAVMAVFGVPVTHEDDALRAVRAAWEMRSAVPELGLTARIGVNTGEVVAGDGDNLVTGDAVNVAARLEQAAEPGQVLIGAETRRLVRDAATVEPVEVVAKGKREPVGAFQIVDLDPEAAAIARRLDASLVGRRRELALLRGAYERTVSEQTCQLFTLLGTAGVGKSRLASELLRDLDATVLTGRCLDYGEGITFWPVVEVLKHLGERGEPAIRRLAEGGSSPGELFRTVRLLFEEVARERPLVVVFDDLHWGEPTFLDLVDHVADLSRGAPLLLLCLARPELLDARPGWGGGKLNATAALLEPFGTDESALLVDGLDDGLDPETRERVLRSAGGNPLFIEEMVALARESGEVAIPSSIQALLQARLDRLGRDERTVIERGAVEGQVFHATAVHQLAPERVRPDVAGHLVGLVRKELIRPDTPTLAGEQAFRFRHLLIRDAAYEGLPKETRADLHERFAGWLERHVELVELDEIVGYHLEQAARYRAELGRPDATLAARAGARLAAAGRRALGRVDMPAAVNLLGRALDCLEHGDPGRLGVALDLQDACYELPDFARADALFAELVATADPAVVRRARLRQQVAQIGRAPHGVVQAAEALLAELAPELQDDDHATRFWAARLAAQLDWFGSRAGPAGEHLQSCVEHASLAGDLRLEADALASLAAAASLGPMPLERMRMVADELEGRSSVIPRATTYASGVRAMIADLEGRHDDARGISARARSDGVERGDAFLVESVDQLLGAHDLLVGHAEEAMAILEASYERLIAYGWNGYASTSSAYLARAYAMRGRQDDAVDAALRAERLSDAEDVINVAIGRGVRARIAADRGEHDQAETLARQAVEHALLTDFPWTRGEAYLDLAYVLRAGGREAEARAAAESARDELEVKGDAARIALVDAFLAG